MTENFVNTGLNGLFGTTPRGGIGMGVHATSWQHRAGAYLAELIGDVRFSYAGRALGRALLVPTVLEGAYDIGTEARCAYLCAGAGE